ncbi:MAG: hypothetical protein C4529_06395 [Deltaproteobacteria bacterium]|nr:MAG: hypothetical protein C4529_06395 [Deltaproteobacteria bacterium]
MKVLVSDASVLIDLARWSLLPGAFRLPYRFVVPDLLFEDKLIDLGDISRADLLRFGLKVESLDPAEIRRAETYLAHYPKLSSNDTFAIALAVGKGYGLLTGDSEMRKLAEGIGVEVHGMLWVFDRLKETRLENSSHLVRILEGMLSDRRTRLPATEIRKRIESWKKK